jgi:putative endonuclease
MSRWVYIIQSQSTGRYYWGQTQDLAKRLLQHNDPTNDLSKTTKRFKGPWKRVLSRQVESGFNTLEKIEKVLNTPIRRNVHLSRLIESYTSERALTFLSCFHQRRIPINYLHPNV